MNMERVNKIKGDFKDNIKSKVFSQLEETVNDDVVSSLRLDDTELMDAVVIVEVMEALTEAYYDELYNTNWSGVSKEDTKRIVEDPIAHLKHLGLAEDGVSISNVYENIEDMYFSGVLDYMDRVDDNMRLALLTDDRCEGYDRLISMAMLKYRNLDRGGLSMKFFFPPTDQEDDDWYAHFQEAFMRLTVLGDTEVAVSKKYSEDEGIKAMAELYGVTLTFVDPADFVVAPHDVVTHEYLRELTASQTVELVEVHECSSQEGPSFKEGLRNMLTKGRRRW